MKSIKGKIENIFHKYIHYNKEPLLFENILKKALNSPENYTIIDNNKTFIKNKNILNFIDSYKTGAISLNNCIIYKSDIPLIEYNVVQSSDKQNPIFIECTPLITIWGFFIHNSKKIIYNQVGGYSCKLKVINSNNTLKYNSSLFYY